MEEPNKGCSHVSLVCQTPLPNAKLIIEASLLMQLSYVGLKSIKQLQENSGWRVADDV